MTLRHWAVAGLVLASFGLGIRVGRVSKATPLEAPKFPAPLTPEWQSVYAIKFGEKPSALYIDDYVAYKIKPHHGWTITCIALDAENNTITGTCSDKKNTIDTQ